MPIATMCQVVNVIIQSRTRHFDAAAGFKRGQALQELLAAKTLVFLSARAASKEIGGKWDLATKLISSITGIGNTLHLF